MLLAKLRYVPLTAGKVRNWLDLLWRYILAKTPLYSGDLFCQFRDGTKMVAPAESGACWPLFEVMMTDDYRLAELRLESAPTLIVDIGAHVGSAAVRLSRMFPQAAVVCYEPNPGTARYLRANLALNGVVADVVEAAVAGEPGTGNLEGSAGLATSTVLLSGKPDLSATRSACAELQRGDEPPAPSRPRARQDGL